MKNVLFDLYGTLIDINTDENRDEFWNKFAIKTKLFKKYNPKDLKNEYLRVCELYAKEKEEIDILNVFETIFNVNKNTAFKIAHIFRKLSTIYIRLYPNVKRTLATLKKRGHKLFILSNAQNAFTIQELKKLDILDYFDGIAISSDYGLKKPNKQFFLNAIEIFKIDKDIWMIGNDYECDIKPAKELKIKTIFIKSNLTPKSRRATAIGFDAKKILLILK